MHDALQGMKIYKHEDLTYSAYKRCRCGAGLAYPKNCKDPYSFWACGYILTTDIKYRPISEYTGPFDAGIVEDEQGVKHDGGFSFVFHEFMKEVTDVTTRPTEELVAHKTKKGRKSK